MSHTILSKWKEISRNLSPVENLISQALEDLETGRPEEACEKFKHVHWKELSEIQEAEGRYLFGIALSQVGRFDDSEDEFRLALLGTSEDSKVLEAWGITLYEAGDHDEAAQKLQAALSIDPSNWSALYNLGNLLAQQGEYDEAINKYQTALQINDSSIDLFICLGHVNCLKEEYKKGEEWFKKGLEKSPKEPLLHLWLGDALDMQGESDNAIISYKTALQIDPSLPDAYEHWGSVLHRLGRSPEALGILEQGLLHVPRDPVICLGMAQVLADQLRLDEALSMAEGAVSELELGEKEIGNDDLLANAHNGVGQILDALGKHEEALEHYYMSVAISPTIKNGFDGIAAIRGVYRENHWIWDIVVSIILKEEEEYRCFQSFEIAALDENEGMRFIREYLERTAGEYLVDAKIEDAVRREQIASYAGILAASEKISVETESEMDDNPGDSISPGGG